jgi:DNA invertase Pin-like site-specific DNA recombinase
MMSQQITPRHLQRLACLYVRQSTLQQVLENTESTARQYALRERAVALGWPSGLSGSAIESISNR